jgi:tRNA threonylcarbamoyl adenosine modification protein (Sua5/YciO/YrdC/YwlC family)|tara:strand:+ start:477 stop:1058 length:582 start_codon:yes stop_codon:yes gene_type:complete
MIYPATEKYIEMAVNSLKNGDVIVYPTDTLYGFGVDATNSDAIQKLNRLKGRSQPLSIVLQQVSDISNYAMVTPEIETELEKLFPGEYTVLLQSIKSNLSPMVFNSSPLVGIRIPFHFFPLQLVKVFGKPVITTSINRHGTTPLNDVTQVEIDFPNVEIFEDNDHTPSQGSTIIDMSQNPFKIVRQGDGRYPK